MFVALQPATQIAIFECTLLESAGIFPGDYILTQATHTASPGEMVLAESAGRKFFGYFQPKGTGASFTLPGREIVAVEYQILARVYKMNDYLTRGAP